MERWVISPFLNEEHIRILNKENMLGDFALCSKSVIISKIIDYINGDYNEEIKDILVSAYKDKITFIDIQNDDLIIENVDKVYSYTFESVHAGLSIQELKDMRDIINSVYNNEYNVPYINTIPGDIIASIINNLLALHRVNNDFEYKKLAYLLTKNKELFKDKPNSNAKGTVFKSISRRSMDLDIILKGIEFLITQKESGKQPETWRLF